MSFFTNVAAIIFRQPLTQKIGKLEIDIVNSRNISESIGVTNNPIEKGFNTDNIIQKPTKISITGTISKFSLRNSQITRIRSSQADSVINREKEAHDELYRIKDSQALITLVMRFKAYSNMIMVELEMPESANDGETFIFTATFQEVRIVESQLVKIDNSKIKTDTAKKTSSFGRQVGENKTFKPKPKISLLQFIKSLF